MATKPQKQNLKNHIETDPQGRGYAGMTPSEIATDMMTEQVSYPAGTTTTWAIFAAIDPGELATQWDDTAATRARMDSVFAMLSSERTIPAEYEDEFQTFIARAFGPGSVTKANVELLLSNKTMTRAEALGYGDRDHDTLTKNIANVLAS